MICRYTNRCIDVKCIKGTASCDGVVGNCRDRLDDLQAGETKIQQCSTVKLENLRSRAVLLLIWLTVHQRLTIWDQGGGGGSKVWASKSWKIGRFVYESRRDGKSTPGQKKGKRGVKERWINSPLPPSFFPSFALSALAERAMSSTLSPGRSSLFTFGFKYQPLHRCLHWDTQN